MLEYTRLCVIPCFIMPPAFYVTKKPVDIRIPS